MKKYKEIDVSETELESLICQSPELIEDGLRYIDHQKSAKQGRIDVLMADSGNALVVAELKVVEQDSMLFQGMDYYDYLHTNIEAIARIYSTHNVDPKQQIRLFLIAPSFSQSLINRCKWVDIPISLFLYKCIQFEKEKEIIPVFNEIEIPSPPEPVEEKYTVEDRLAYITDDKIRKIASDFLSSINDLGEGHIQAEAIKYAVSLKVNGRVFAYFSPRRKSFHIEMDNQEGKWASYPVNDKKDLEEFFEQIKYNVEKKKKI